MVPEHAPAAAPVCPQCADTGAVCENHPDRPWGPLCCRTAAYSSSPCVHGACGCGAGDPCPACCSPIPAGGRLSDAFVPDRLRDRRGRLATALNVPASQWHTRSAVITSA